MRAPWLLLGLLVACGGGGAGDDGDAAVDPSGDGGARGDGGATPHTIFVAQGHAGRTVMSCDGGHTWTADRSDDPDVRCFADAASDCDHGAGAGRGLGYADGRFYATFGWGQPGGVRTSDDGVTWPPTLTGTTFGGVGAGAGWVIGGGHDPQVSRDRGATWAATTSPTLAVWNVRRTAAVDVGGADGARVVLVGNDADVHDAVISGDGGVTWWHPALPGGCADGDLQSGGGIAAGDGVLVIASAQATAVACRSTDGGQTFTAHPVGGAIDSQLVWTGTEFLAWGAGHVVRSGDGLTWTRTPTTPAGLQLGVLGAADGALVAVRGGWQVWYEDERFYRSDDGVAWEELAAGTFTGGHPLRHVIAGRVAGSAACP